MRFLLSLGLAVAGLLSSSFASDDCEEINGNWYCSEVESVSYQGVGEDGTYNMVTDMSGGSCGQESHSFSGDVAPFNEEVSVHFRGPVHLKQFAVYKPEESSYKSKRFGRRHGHGHLHIRDLHQNMGRGSASWNRVSYYNASSGTADGLVFLNNKGGSESGVFDYVYGNSLSYMGADGTSAASSPNVLDDAVLSSASEFSIFSDVECDGDCDYVRPGTVAYRGWDGGEKAFLMEFSMPMESDSESSELNYDMPSIWLLNANIPRTAQYSSCSCWPECGEFDIFEVLDSGNERCKSTMHVRDGRSVGSSDYFKRPSSDHVKVAVLLSNNAMDVSIIPSDTTFDTTLNIESLCDAVNGTVVSVE